MIWILNIHTHKHAHSNQLFDKLPKRSIAIKIFLTNSMTIDRDFNDFRNTSGKKSECFIHNNNKLTSFIYTHTEILHSYIRVVRNDNLRWITRFGFLSHLNIFPFYFRTYCSYKLPQCTYKTIEIIRPSLRMCQPFQ